MLLSQLKHQHEVAFDCVADHGWAHELTHRLREALVISTTSDHIAAIAKAVSPYKPRVSGDRFYSQMLDAA
ncbi:hypothetical protein DBR42_05650 [Pelomonas sp. HMWF004]|nr:hypothetical protein DBR42_05650 [Pelomonas sp. HMWF004]